MDKALRNTLRNTVTRIRAILEQEIGDVLEGQFGIHRDGGVEPVAALAPHTAEDAAYREQILAQLEHIRAGGFGAPGAVAQLIREVAYTHLNRLAAYKILEGRKLIRAVTGLRNNEVLARGQGSNGFKFYLADHPADEALWAGGDQERAYRHFLGWLAAQLGAEVGVLFSPHDPANRLFPRGRVLDEVLQRLNDDELKEVWDADETVGWIYQYFTPKELRDQARKESAAPRTGYELAFRNQFFTPRYVVEFLADNTLGRLWYEMRGGATALREQCRYLVRRKDEIFLGNIWGDEVRAAERWLQGADVPLPDATTLAHVVNGYQRHPLNTPDWWDWIKQVWAGVLAGRTAAYTTQDLLDCLFCMARADHGSGGYGIDVEWPEETAALMAAIRERRAAWTGDGEGPRPVFIPYREKRDPRTIRVLDPACGSGHFLLYAYDLLETVYAEAYDDPDLEQELKRDYPTRERYAAAVPGLILAENLHGIDIDVRATQIAAFALWLRAQRSYGAGSLEGGARPPITRTNIVAAEPMPGEADLLAEFTATLPGDIAALVREVFGHMRKAGEIGSLLKIEALTRDAVRRATSAYGMFDAEEATRWRETEDAVVAALAAYAEAATNGAAYRRALFAGDARQGFGFLDLCRRRYDVVLMNPPFGAAALPAKSYIEGAYPRSKQDLYAAFVERGLGWLKPGGLLGAITSRTGFFLTSFQKWREEIILREARPTVFADLGQGVLDTAMVETAAYCLEVVK